MHPLFVVGAVWELGWWAIRRQRRADVYRKALAHANAIGRPLVVIGAPDSGPTAGYGCGDLTVDIAPSSCPCSIQADITDRIPLPDDSAVVFCSCVLEYVHDHEAALREIFRISGGHAFFVGVEPWTLTSFLYPGAKRTLPSEFR